MSRCAAMNDELGRVALGARPSEALTTHLHECRACAAELERQRALASRMDSAVGDLVRAEPPSRMFERVMTRVRNAEPARRWPWNTVWSRAAVAAALAASVVGVLFSLRAMQSPAPPDQAAAAISAWRSPTATLMKPSGSVLDAPLHDVWFDTQVRPSHSQTTDGDNHAA